MLLLWQFKYICTNVNMKNTLGVLLIFLMYNFGFSQYKIKVTESLEDKPVSGAKIYCQEKLLGTTNAVGILNFNTKCKVIKIKSTGFYEEDAIVDKMMEASLVKVEKHLSSIETIVLEDKSDARALAILDKVEENYEKNSPKSLPSYSYKSYEKISVDIDEDSLKQYNQSLSEMMKFMDRFSLTKSKKERDTAITVKEVFVNSKLFLWERAQEFLFSKKYGEKINVLDNRIAGLNQPLFEMMAVQSNRNQMPREIQKKNRKLYRYFLTDTIDIEGRQNFVIRFREVSYKQPIQNRKFNGYLYVDAETYGLKKIESNNKTKSNGSITSIWKLVDGKWFLDSENIKMKLTNMEMETEEQKKAEAEKKKKDKTADNFRSYGFVTAKYFDHKTNIEDDPKNFRGYTFSVKNADGTLMQKYRSEKLTEREKNTYTVIDSLSQEYDIEKKAKGLTSLVRGKLRLGKIDFDLAKLLAYNLYEGFRLGVGFKTNEKFHPYISPDIYAAYGFKDNHLKYGAGVDFKTTLEKTSFFRAEYYNDVMAAGRFNENFWDFLMKLNNAGVALNNDRFYHFDGVKLSYENDLTNTLSMKISARRQREEVRFDYNYQNLGNAFENSGFTLSLEYAPFSKNIMTPNGKFTTEKKLPEFYFNAEKALKTLGGDFDYTKFDFLVNHSFKSKIGTTGLRLYGGLLLGEAPIWHHFTMNGLSGNKKFNFNLTSYLGFATMKGGEYYNDKFIGNYITHKIPWYFKSFGQNTSSFDVIHRSIIGNMKNPEFHQFDFKKLDHLYQEVGLEWNNFFSTYFNLGVFYRVGYYHTPKFSDNFAVQLKFKLLGF